MPVVNDDMLKLMNYGFSKLHLENATKPYVNPTAIRFIKKFLVGFSIRPDTLLKNYVRQNRGYNLFLWSEKNGTGKTTLLHKLACYLRTHSKRIGYLGTIHFGQVTEIFRQIREHAMSTDEVDMLQYLIDCDIVFIDDLDKAGSLTKFQMESLRLLIDKRYREIKPIFMTANKSLDKLLEDNTIDSAIHSRFQETCQVYELGSIDHRLNKIEMKVKLRGKSK